MPRDRPRAARRFADRLIVKQSHGLRPEKLAYDRALIGVEEQRPELLILPPQVTVLWKSLSERSGRQPNELGAVVHDLVPRSVDLVEASVGQNPVYNDVAVRIEE